MPLCILHLKKELNELDFWFSSYGYFSDIGSKTPSSGQTVIFYFFINFFYLCLSRHLSEKDFNFEVENLLHCH